ncbi:DUF5361 domain-containing protein [Nocardia sp. 852002-20019_SCH5090214]|uniref:DUF5361 domain-containing protein n=1 Tax=Nocardia sp. 852002-20019_SCH5090214 TaxID=1834087 RepID=UPI000B21FBC2|nr:DUF5361 domain-containing protein [Nocardia sp. 852002-20019_SCH5090214]
MRDLGTDALTWGDLKAIVAHLGEDSALGLAMNPPPDEAPWTRMEMLVAEAVDTLHLLWWAKTEAGQKNRNRPARIPRPGVEPVIKRYGDAPMSIEDMDKFLGWEVAA